MSCRLTLLAVLALAALCYHTCEAAADPRSPFVDVPATHQFAKRGIVDRILSYFFKGSWYPGSRAAAIRLGSNLDSLKFANQAGIKAQVSKLREAEKAFREAKKAKSVAQLQKAADTAQANLIAGNQALRTGKAQFSDIDRLLAKVKEADAALLQAQKRKPLKELGDAVQRERSNLQSLLKADSELLALRAAETADFEKHVGKLRDAENAFLASRNGKSVAELEKAAEQARKDLLFAGPRAANMEELAANVDQTKNLVDKTKKFQEAVRDEEANLRAFLSADSPRLARMKQLEIELGVQGARGLGVQGARGLGVQGARELGVQGAGELGVQGAKELGEQGVSKASKKSSATVFPVDEFDDIPL